MIIKQNPAFRLPVERKCWLIIDIFFTHYIIKRNAMLIYRINKNIQCSHSKLMIRDIISILLILDFIKMGYF